MSLRTRPLFVASASLLVFVLVIAAAAISVFATTPGNVETQPQLGNGEHRLFVPGLVANAEGTYAPFPTVTPAPTVVGVQDAENRLFVARRGDDAGDGTRDDPFATIAQALVFAREIESAEIYVSTGIFAEPIEIIEHAVELHDGYSFDWQRLDGQYRLLRPFEGIALFIGGGDNIRVEGSNWKAAPLASASNITKTCRSASPNLQNPPTNSSALLLSAALRPKRSG